MSSKLLLASVTIFIISCLLSSVLKFSENLYKSSSSSSSSSNEEEEVNNIPIDEGAFGPESFAFDPSGGGPYTGVSDGRIIKWQPHQRRWINFATTSSQRHGCERTSAQQVSEHICGRPLGLVFNQKSGDLYIADAYMGLLSVGPNGGLANQIATQAQGIPLAFTNALDIDQSNGLVYFTDSSSVYKRRNYVSAIVSGDKTGRLMKYDPKTSEVTVILKNLSFPNGVSLSRDGDYILIAETTNCRILKFWIKTSKAGMVEVLAELPGFPDNIKRNEKGEFWVGIYGRRGNFIKWVLSSPWIGNILVKLPLDITEIYSYLASFRACGLAVKLNGEGKILVLLEDENGKKWKFISEV
uniref:Strictosidine synthase n=1 Tax=Nothapodytes nimmoniana TaxID=159386 RepID=A0A343JM12_NOTNI|nr:strictosidine synthase [Nothapodytes nimmoniana]